MAESKNLGLFDNLVNSLGLQTMIALGKFSPGGHAPEVRLDDAQQLIDILGMLQEKTAGNLTDRERSLLELTLTNLRLTYVEEVKRKPTVKGDEPEVQPETEPES